MCPIYLVSTYGVHRYALLWDAYIILYLNFFQPQVPLRLPCYDFTWVTNHDLEYTYHSIMYAL